LFPKRVYIPDSGKLSGVGARVVLLYLYQIDKHVIVFRHMA
jgi:hypothetical protein